VIFEEQSNVANLIQKIMMHTQSLLQCQRCQVMLVDSSTKVHTNSCNLHIALFKWFCSGIATTKPIRYHAYTNTSFKLSFFIA